MKSFGFLIALFVAVVLTPACHPNPTNYTVPAGYQTCRTSWDCPRGTYCGFVAVDTYAVCKQ